MNQLRGMMMLVAAGMAFYKGWRIHYGQHAWLAYGLGLLALGLAAWHWMRAGAARRRSD